MHVLQQFTLALLIWDRVVDVPESKYGLVLRHLLHGVLLALVTTLVRHVGCDMRSRARLFILGLPTTSLNRLLDLLGNLATLEDGDGATAGIGLHELHAEGRQEDEEDKEGPKEAEVTPEMGSLVGEGFVYVCGATDTCFTRDGTFEGARLVLRRGLGPLRDEVGWYALEVEEGEFIGHETFEAVLDPVDPS